MADVWGGVMGPMYERGEVGQANRRGAEGWTNIGGGRQGHLKTIMQLDTLKCYNFRTKLIEIVVHCK